MRPTPTSSTHEGTHGLTNPVGGSAANSIPLVDRRSPATDPPPVPSRYREYLDDEGALRAAVDRAAGSSEPLWDLAIVAWHFITAKRYEDALRIYDAIVERRTLELSAYCNALWVVQQDNTGLPVDGERSRRYLRAALPHAPMNPAIHLNAACVLMELEEPDAAIAELVQAARRRVELTPHLEGPLFAPLRAHERWPEVEALAEPAPRFDALMLAHAGVTAELGVHSAFAGEAFGAVSCAQIVEAMELALAHEHPHLRHDAARQAVFWRYADDDEDHMGQRSRWHPFHWHPDLCDALTEAIPTARLMGIVEGDLLGPYVHEATHTFDIVARGVAHGMGIDLFESLGGIAPLLAELLRTGDDAVRFQITDGLIWLSARPGAQAVFLAHLAEPLGALVESIASAGSLSDAPKVQRDQLRWAVKCLEDVGRLGEHRDALERLVSEARGEIADRYHREELERLLASL